MLDIVGARRDREGRCEMAIGGVEIAAREEHPSTNDVDPQQGHALRVERQRSGRRRVDVVPIATLERDHRRIGEQVAAVRPVEPQLSSERRSLPRELERFVEPLGDQQ